MAVPRASDAIGRAGPLHDAATTCKMHFASRSEVLMVEPGEARPRLADFGLRPSTRLYQARDSPCCRSCSLEARQQPELFVFNNDSELDDDDVVVVLRRSG